jgi:ABC-2 type transport system permease protein
MHPVVAIAAKDLRQRFRDRSAIVLGFVAPVAIAALMSVAFGGGENYHLDVAVVDQDHGELATAFATMIGGPDLADYLTVHPAVDEATARRQVADGSLGAAFVLPAGFTAAAQGAAAGAATVPVTVLGGVDQPVGTQVAAAIAGSFTAQLNAVRLSVGAALAAGVPVDQVAELAGRAARQRLPEEVIAQPLGAAEIRMISYYGPGMGMFFALFAIGFTARGFFAERRDGTLDRLSAAPLRRGAVLAGKSLATMVYGLASLTTMAVVTTVVFDADWGPPLAAAALIIAMTVAMVSLTGLVIAVARTDRQAEAVSSIITFGLVLLGGNFVFISAAPPLLRRLALLTPNGWALRGFTDLATGAGGWSAVRPVIAILVFATMAAGVAAVVAALPHRRAVS